jgi:type II secretory pathway pseudopilin PulG
MPLTTMGKLSRCGFSLLEVVVGSVVLLVLTLSFILTLVYANRAAAMAALQTSATHILDGEIERMRYDYNRLNPSNYPDITTTSPANLKKYLDFERKVPITLQYDIVSTFPVTSVSGNNITVGGVTANALRGSTFANNEWQGSCILIVSGKGYSQRAYVTGNAGNVLSVTADTTGATQTSLTIQPNNTSVIQFNSGKVVTVRLAWAAFNRAFSEEVKSVVLPPGY